MVGRLALTQETLVRPQPPLPHEAHLPRSEGVRLDEEAVSKTAGRASGLGVRVPHLPPWAVGRPDAESGSSEEVVMGCEPLGGAGRQRGAGRSTDTKGIRLSVGRRVLAPQSEVRSLDPLPRGHRPAVRIWRLQRHDVGSTPTGPANAGVASTGRAAVS